jgi:hypothetical protein
VFPGGIDGPIPMSAVYECFDDEESNPYIHCPGGVQSGCPNPCFEFHTAEGVSHHTSNEKPASYRDMCIRDEGDGISAESAAAGPIEVLRTYFTNIHDDAVETDWCDPISVQSVLIDRAFMAFAANPRSGASCDASTIRVENSLVRLHRFANTYKQRNGHGGVFKLDNSDLSWFIVKNSTFLIGSDTGAATGPGDGQHYLPPPSQTNSTDCVNNTILFSGDNAQLQAWLADEDGADGADERREARRSTTATSSSQENPGRRTATSSGVRGFRSGTSGSTATRPPADAEAEEAQQH